MEKKLENIPFSRPFIGKEEEEAVLAVLRSGWLTTGKETHEFEKDFEKFLSTNTDTGLEKIHCMAVNSATSGLHLALEALGIQKGHIVLLPSMTFTASAEVVSYLGAEVVFVDVVKGGGLIDPECLEKTIYRLKKGQPAYPRRSKEGRQFGPYGKTLAVMPVHLGGLPCDMEAILSIAKKNKLYVVEDAAHSFPSFIPAETPGQNGHWAGLMGDLGVYSFYATKTITTGEGGMVVTADEALAKRIRIMRSHGIDRSIWDRYTDTKASWFYQVVEPGFKYNIPDILSALGRVQLKRAMDLLVMRQKLAKRYDEAFANDEHFSIPQTGSGDARHLYTLKLNLDRLSVTRDEFAAKMQEQGIGISVHFIPLHTMPYYKNRYGLKDNDFPETMDLYKRIISLPIWPGMTDKQIDRVIEVVKTLGSDYDK